MTGTVRFEEDRGYWVVVAYEGQQQSKRKMPSMAAADALCARINSGEIQRFEDLPPSTEHGDRHGHSASRDGKPSPTYTSWRSMKNRVRDGKPPYDQVSICRRWSDSFATFLADMGERPAGTSLDRIDPAGNYEPTNCRWASHQEQMDNKVKPPPRTGAEWLARHANDEIE